MPRKQTPSGYNAATLSRSNVHRFPAKPGSSATHAEHIQRSCPLSTNTHTHTAKTHALAASVSVYTCYPTQHTLLRKGQSFTSQSKMPVSARVSTDTQQTERLPFSSGRVLLNAGLGGRHLPAIINYTFSSGFHAASSWQRNREHWSNAIGDTGALVPVSPCVKTRSDGSETRRRWDPKACQ